MELAPKWKRLLVHTFITLSMCSARSPSASHRSSLPPFPVVPVRYVARAGPLFQIRAPVSQLHDSGPPCADVCYAGSLRRTCASNIAVFNKRAALTHIASSTWRRIAGTRRSKQAAAATRHPKQSGGAGGVASAPAAAAVRVRHEAHIALECRVARVER